MTSTERGRGGYSVCHISVLSVLEKQPGIQCYDNIAFHLAHTPDNGIFKKAPFMSNFFFLCYLDWIMCTESGSFTRSFATHTQNTWEGQAPGRGATGNTGMKKRVDLPSAVLLPSADTPAHNWRRGAEKGGHDSSGWVGHITLRDSLIFPGPLSIHLLCPPSTATCSENNITFWSCQLTEPSI